MYKCSYFGNVAELVDAADSKSAGATLESSILSIPTKLLNLFFFFNFGVVFKGLDLSGYFFLFTLIILNFGISPLKGR